MTTLKMLMALSALSLSGLCLAGEKVGAWELFTDVGDMQIARTMNQDGAATGVICFKSSNSCVTYFTTSSGCVVV